MRTDSSLPRRRFSTRLAYEAWLNNHVSPKWGNSPITALQAYEVEKWLKSLPLSAKSRMHIRGLIRQLWDYAMLRRDVPRDRNPMDLVTIKGGTKRTRKPRSLTTEEFHKLVQYLEGPIRTIALVCVCFGLRISECLALKWSDVDWVNSKLRVERAIVRQRVDDVKTIYSGRQFSIDREMLAVLKVWRQISQFTEANDWIFASPVRIGRQPISYPWVWKCVQFTALPGFEMQPSFSPDGAQIVFMAGSTEGVDLYVKALGDEKILRLTQPPGMSFNPKWSPDGRTIAYTHITEISPGTFERAIFLMTSLGGAKHPIRKIPDALGGITSWSPDAKLLAYSDQPAGEKSGIFLMPPTGSPALRLTTAPDTMLDESPAFSPDGKQIAFVRNTISGGRADLYLVSVLGRKERKLTSLNRGVGPPTWTADGKKIIFEFGGFLAGESALFSVATSGGEPERLQFISSEAADPAISRQGDKLAYVTAFQDSNIWRVSIKDGAAPAKLIASSRMDVQPDFSPDGTRLAFVSNREGPSAIWGSNADGTDPVRLSSLRGGTPAWSPSGRQIAFDTNERGPWDIVVMAAEGGNEERLTDDRFDHRAPSWSSDGEWVYFTSNRSGRWEIWKASFRTREAFQVTRRGGGYGQESPDGKFIYYQKPRDISRLDSGLFPEIWRTPSGGGPEELVVNVNDPTHPADLTWFWRVTTQGIYFVDNSARPNPLLKLFSLATRTVRTVRQLDKQAWGGPGLAVSPDGRTVLIGQVDDEGSDIMLVENFH